MSAATQCTQGSYCAVTGLSAPNGTCDSGYYCVTGSSTATQNLCSSGTYCPVGSYETTVCPAFGFCASSGLANYTLCTAGYYCNTTGLSAVSGPCDLGFWCPSPSSSPRGSPSGGMCLPGTYCGANSALPTACLPGSYCPLPALSAPRPCDAGFFCNATALSAVSGMCRANEFSVAGQSNCTHCPGALLSLPGSSMCHVCLADTCGGT